MWIISERNKTDHSAKVPVDPNTWYIYPSVDVKPCPCVLTWTVTVFYPSPLPLLQKLQYGWNVDEIPSLTSLICPLARLTFFSFRLSAACYPSIAPHPLTRKRSCGEICPLYIFPSGNVLVVLLCVYEHSKMSVVSCFFFSFNKDACWFVWFWWCARTKPRTVVSTIALTLLQASVTQI